MLDKFNRESEIRILKDLKNIDDIFGG
jgi:hypothetical protein